MTHIHNHTNENGVDELALFTRITTGLAALTGLLYLRVVLGGGLLQTFVDNLTLWLAVTTGLLVLGIAGALISWRMQGVGAGLLLTAGLGLGIAFFWLQRNWGTAVFYGSPFTVAGILCIFCQLRKR